ncbi:MAG: DUF1566 domain-containing protein [Helicobacteraceae bacterium]
MKKTLYFLLAALYLHAGVAQECLESVEKTAPNTRFKIDGANKKIVKDLATGLTWLRCPLNQTFDEKNSACKADANYVQMGVKSFKEALRKVQEFNADAAKAMGKIWRLPNAKEMLSILEASCVKPALNSVYFPIDYVSESDFYKSAFYFWTSTPVFNADTGNILIFTSVNGSIMDPQEPDQSTDPTAGFGILLVTD